MSGCHATQRSAERAKQRRQEIALSETGPAQWLTLLERFYQGVE
jgi:hypothetical protein